MARFLRRNSGSRQRVSRRKRLTPELHVKAAYWLVPLVPGCEVEGSSAGISVEGASVPCGAVVVLLPPLSGAGGTAPCCCCIGSVDSLPACCSSRSEEHTSELQSLMRISYAVFCLKKKKNKKLNT